MKKSSLKILHISDTHSFHSKLKLDLDGIDLIIHSGDCSNFREPYRNEYEIRSFLDWYGSLETDYGCVKIYVAGNHDTSIEKNLVTDGDFVVNDILYLENDYLMIKGFKIWGSPITPTYGNWSFMRSRAKIYSTWDNIPDDTDILITHGPPKGILDLSEDVSGRLEHCGCGNLRKQLNRLENLKLCCFGHIHNCDQITNSGILTLPDGTIYSNAAAVEDGKFNGTIVNHGNIIELMR